MARQVSALNITLNLLLSLRCATQRETRERPTQPIDTNKTSPTTAALFSGIHRVFTTAWKRGLVVWDTTDDYDCRRGPSRSPTASLALSGMTPCKTLNSQVYYLSPRDVNPQEHDHAARGIPTTNTDKTIATVPTRKSVQEFNNFQRGFCLQYLHRQGFAKLYP